MVLTNKKAVNPLSVGIILMAFILLFGGILMDDSNNSNSNSNHYNDEINKILSNEYLFYLNDTVIGRENKVISSFSNVILGSKIEYNIIYMGNTFYLNSNPLTSSKYNITFSLENPDEVKGILIYFNTKRKGKEDLIVRVDGKEVSRNRAESKDIPIKAYLNFKNTTTITFTLNKPKWYDIFNWNQLEVYDFKIVEVREDKTNKEKTFNFKINKDSLKSVYVDMTISCEEYSGLGSAPAIEGFVNKQEVFNDNPNCQSRYTILSKNIPLDILSNKNNNLTILTDGYYKIALRINQVYYNEQDVYYFQITSFNDLVDIIMYGDFDKEVLDIKLNGKYLSLKRDQIRSVLKYLQYGTNELVILTKPIEIKKLVIEKTNSYYLSN